MNNKDAMTQTDIFDEELNQLLAEDIKHAVQREQSTFDRLSAPHERDLVLFGAGDLGRKTIRGLRRVGIEPLALTDNNPKLWGTSIEDVNVLSPAQALEKFNSKASFIMTIWNINEPYVKRKKQLDQMGFKNIIPFGLLFWKYPQVFLPYFPIDLPHRALEQAARIRQAYTLFEDADSKNEFVAQMRFRLLMDFEHLPFPVAPPIYFLPNLIRSTPDDCFIDVGAFSGDTIADYIRIHPLGFRKVVAYEPDPISFRALEEYRSHMPVDIQDRILCFQYGLDEVHHEVIFDAQGTEFSSIGSGHEVIECFPLDQVLSDRPTQIKMDIEGFEIDALRGARCTIQKYAPILSISVYHRQNHLWEIPNLIASMRGDYSYYLRPHRVDGWDEVLYAIPKSAVL
jgi:FkbM family methyltransferase